ncbi:MAG: hypothetical protein WAT19_16135 [Ferruginibacter sp.]
MFKQISMLALGALLIGTSCRKIEVDGTTNTPPTGNTENTILEGRITSNKTLKADFVYKLRGLVYVTNGAVLTIEAGTKIVGETGQRGGLIITRNAKISADGTADKPIVFTSEAASPARGDWAGLVILGNAPTNSAFNGTSGVGEIEGGINNSDGLGLYGGTNPADNSGTLRYVRIEYAGFAFLPDKEINGLTFGGVGNQTVVDHVQVSYANDDSFEWFGGTVNCKHLIAYKGLDDDFDTDNGYAGKVQFAIGFRDSAIADISGSNGFESDNDANGSALNPQTGAVFSNVTLIGPKAALNSAVNSNYRRGMHLRRNSALSVFNSVVMGWSTGWLLDASTGTPTDLNIGANKMVLANNILAGNNTQFSYSASASAPTGWASIDVTNYFNRTDGGNTVLATTAEVGLADPFKYDNTVNFNPTSGSPALTGASFTNAKISSLTQVSYRGACSDTDTWWKSWTKFN